MLVRLAVCTLLLITPLVSASPSLAGVKLTSSTIADLLKRTDKYHKGDPYPFHVTKNVKTLLRLFSSNHYPNPLAFKVNGTLPKDIWTTDVVGRLNAYVNMAGGLQDTAEYFLGTVPTSPTNGFIVNSQVIRRLLEDKEKNTITATYETVFYNPSTHKEVHLTQNGWFHFNKHGLIDQYDNSFIGLGRWLLEMSPSWRTPNGKMFFINRACADHDQYCTGSNKQYATNADCVNFLSSIDFGLPDWLYESSAFCRYFHSLMTPYRPQVHCVHVGPTGGDRCINTPYQAMFDYYDNYTPEFAMNVLYTK
jgi:hypothetical protein